VATSLVGGGLIIGVLTWRLELWRFRHQRTMDVWGQIQQTWDKRIDLLEKAGRRQEADQRRLEYEEQQAAWRAKQQLNAVAPRQVQPKGETSLTEGELAELRRLLAASHGLNPGALSASDHFLRGNSYYETGQYPEALADFNRALELRPDHPNTLNNRGSALARLGRYDEALADYSRALELRPNHPDTLNNRGSALWNLGRYDEALADCNRALELRPDHPGTLNNRGATLARLGRYDEALADYNRALELRPDYSSALYNKACLFSLTQRYPEALDWLARAIAGDAKYPSMAAQDEDFVSLRDHPQFGPRFRQLIGGGVSPPSLRQAQGRL
jgi:tetratricopeptide (TPR) repeat protein